MYARLSLEENGREVVGGTREREGESDIARKCEREI